MNLIKSIYKYIKLAILIIFLTIVVTFCINNNYSVTISLNPLPYQMEIKLFLLVIIFFLIGVLTGFLTLSKSLIGSKINNIINSRKVEKLQNKISKNTK